eukprot:GHVP01066410.1.p1 GENE.GHVP01066410.1~~GHVP01066410.1.p1  ORF type:complete len:758 (+),score=124.85 GHVP01066410.1:135-2408(+)
MEQKTNSPNQSGLSEDNGHLKAWDPAAQLQEDDSPTYSDSFQFANFFSPAIQPPLILPNDTDSPLFAYVDHIADVVMDKNDPDGFLWFIRSEAIVKSLERDVQPPIIEDAFVDTERRIALILCHDEASRNALICLSPFVTEFGIEVYIETPPAANGMRTSMTDTSRILQNPQDWMLPGSPPDPPGTALWPGQKHVSAVKDEGMRKRLCAFGRFKPQHWPTETVSKFLEGYCQIIQRLDPNYKVPGIASVWAYEGRSFVTIAFVDEISRCNFLRLRVAYVATHSQGNNMNKKSEEKSFMMFEGFQDLRGSQNITRPPNIPLASDDTEARKVNVLRRPTQPTKHHRQQQEVVHHDDYTANTRFPRHNRPPNTFERPPPMSRSRSRSPAGRGLPPVVTMTEWPRGIKPAIGNGVSSETLEELKMAFGVVCVDHSGNLISTPEDPMMYLAYLNIAFYLNAFRNLQEVPVIEHIGIAPEISRTAKILIAADLFSAYLLVQQRQINLQIDDRKKPLWINFFPYISTTAPPLPLSPREFVHFSPHINHPNLTWPGESPFYAVPDDVKMHLCVAVRYKPPEWNSVVLLDNLNGLFNRLSRYGCPPVKAVDSQAENGSTSAVVAFETEAQRNIALAVRVLYIPHEKTSALRPYLVIMKYNVQTSRLSQIPPMATAPPNQLTALASVLGARPALGSSVNSIAPPSVPSQSSMLTPVSFPPAAAPVTSSASVSASSSGDAGTQDKKDALLIALKNFASTVSKRQAERK